MQDYKINHFMDIGDIIYTLVLFFFFAIGLVGDFRKKKASKQQNAPKGTPIPKAKPKKMKPATIPSQNRWENQTPPPVATQTRVEPMVHKEFQSSLNLSASTEGYSSLQDSLLTNTSHEQISETDTKITQLHPILKDLTGENRGSEFRKAIIYSEILKRKY